MNLNVPFVMTKSGITVYLDGRGESVAKDHPSYEKILAMLTDGQSSTQEIADLVNVSTAVINLSGGRVQIKDDTFFWDGIEMANALTVRIIDLLKKSKSIDGLVRFMTNLMENPSFHAVNELYGFLDACTLPLTADGCFLAYKKVNKEYKSIHKNQDGTQMDNSIGKVVSMPRNQVDENSNQACSNGLHCCSFEYLAHYGDAFDKVIIVKVNPKNVVAVPKDYNNQKMRVCEYEVVSELPNDQVTELRDKYSTDEYDDTDESEYGDDGDGEPTGGEPVESLPVAKKVAPIGDWECREAWGRTGRGELTQLYGNMTANQAKAAFARERKVAYTDVRVRKA